jgi:hypothetical protein
MLRKAKLASVAFGAALLAGIAIPAASASTASASSSEAPFCNETSPNGPFYGCAESSGLAKAVTLIQYHNPSTATEFSYSNKSDQFAEDGTDLCLNFNPDSSAYPINMNTCNGNDQYERWIHYGSSTLLWENVGDNSSPTDCLEGSEVVVFGKPLVMDPCSDNYDGQNWAQP